MSDYEFVSVWELKAPIEPVWDLIENADEWPSWWKGVLRSVELMRGDDNGVGSIRRTTWKSALPYKLEFDSEVLSVEKHRSISMRAFGELDGKGLWTFNTHGGTTRVQYDWVVRTTKLWMNVLSPVARPFFRWNHDVIMRWGEEGLRMRLAATPQHPSPS